MSKDVVAHRWAIDSMEEGVARVEQDGRTMLTIPAWLLPAGSTEGQILSVTRSETAGSCTIVVAPDTAATSAALDASRATTNKMAKDSKRRDAGGDVAL